MNPNITRKDKAAIKGALRRAFARSDLHRQVIEESIIHGYSDPERPRVKTWCRCNVCTKPEAKSYMVVDHMITVVPLDKSIHDMEIPELVDRLWCERKNLQACCPACHQVKSAAENLERKKHRKAKK